MNILKQTELQLIFRSRSPWDAWTSWILGFIVSSIALTFSVIRLVAIALPPTLECRRIPEQSVSCQFKKYQFPLSWKITNIPAGDLQKARLDRDSGNG